MDEEGFDFGFDPKPRSFTLIVGKGVEVKIQVSNNVPLDTIFVVDMHPRPVHVRPQG